MLIATCEKKSPKMPDLVPKVATLAFLCAGFFSSCARLMHPEVIEDAVELIEDIIYDDDD